MPADRFTPEASDADLNREKGRARELRQSTWWKRRIVNAGGNGVGAGANANAQAGVRAGGAGDHVFESARRSAARFIQRRLNGAPAEHQPLE